MKIPQRRKLIPAGMEAMQPNRLFESDEDCVDEYGDALVKTWRDKQSGKVCCQILVPKGKKK